LPAKIQSTYAYYRDDRSTALTDEAETPLGWHVLWTRSNSEHLVWEQLLAKNYEVFLPMIDEISMGSVRGRRRPIRRVPMFKGYLFLRHRINRTSFIDISNTKGVVHILGPRWNRLAQVPDEELASIKRAQESREPMLPYPYLKVGSRVRITRGTLTNAQGILVRTDLAKGLLVISVELLQRSIAVKVSCADVGPI
jgi:transcription antitermination factor NusG